MLAKFPAFKIGALTLPYPMFLAPLAGVSALPLRAICRRYGCPCAYIEMVDANSLTYSSPKTCEALKTDAQDRPLGLQLLGNDPDQILRALDNLQDYKYDLLDFNAACPVRKVTTKDKGASLLKAPRRLQAILTGMVRYSAVPVTAKIRLGWNDDKKAVDIARTAEDAGIAALVVHGRTKSQLYSGKVNYPAIAKIKKNLRIPVIASGDIFDVPLAKKMFEETGCDAIMVARGALGNPWIFQSLAEFFTTGRDLPRPSRGEVAGVMREHYQICEDFYGETRAVVNFRKFFMWYTHGHEFVRGLRREAGRAVTASQLGAIIDEFADLERKKV